MNRKTWVEPKTDAKKELVLDLSRLNLTSYMTILDAWEKYVDIIGELPDVIVMTQGQYYWYADSLIDFANIMGLAPCNSAKVNFRGLSIRIK